MTELLPDEAFVVDADVVFVFEDDDVVVVIILSVILFAALFLHPDADTVNTHSTRIMHISFDILFLDMVSLPFLLIS